MLLSIVYGLLLIVKLAIADEHDHELPGHMSLPNLLLQDDIDRIALNWKLSEDMSLSNGRLVSHNGALWSIPRLAGSSNEWTIEYVFRSNGSREAEISSADVNDLSFWLITDPEPEIGKAIDKYDGFRFSVNSKQYSGLKLFNNDGSKAMSNQPEESIGSCLFNYQDSMIPFTVRISYSKPKNWFKIQVDNNLCFKTDKIQIPSGGQDFKFGFTTNSASQETWEIFKLNVWSHLTSDASDDHDLMMELPIEAVKPDSNQETIYTPAHNRASLLERARKHQNELNRNEPPQLDNDQLQISHRLLKKLNEMEARLQTGNVGSSGDYEDIRNVIKQMKDDISDFKLSFVRYQSEMLNTIQKLNDKVISEVREYQYSNSELNKKIDFLLESHRDTSYKLDTQRTRELNASSISNAFIYWILIPLVIGTILVVISIYRLRRDIKHSKLL